MNPGMNAFTEVMEVLLPGSHSNQVLNRMIPPVLGRNCVCYKGRGGDLSHSLKCFKICLQMETVL